MQITDFQATYYSYLLTRHSMENSIETLAATLQDSKVDLNPHQIEAALFALRSPYSRGIIEADEVGLGKTIVAGIVMAQKWAEDKKRILIIVPASLRRQWQLELEDKFYLPSTIIDGDSFKHLEKTQQNPFFLNDIVITSYHFAHSKAEYISQVNWDLCVIDEAHKLRNVYKPDNTIARSIRDALKDSYKMLLTATPLQNSLLELYGLVSFIDEYTFGNLESFKAQFSFIRDEKQKEFTDLTSRLKGICIRTLRRQVLEYIKYTERLPITQEFTPSPAEQELYDKFSTYLQRDKLWALPNSGRHLISLLLWKLLASSTFAIAGTLETLINRLQAMLDSGYHNTKAVSGIDFGDELALSDYEEETLAPIINRKKLTESEKQSLRTEIEELQAYHALAISIKNNAKGDALIIALEKGFAKLKDLKAPQKSVIFTESRRTQEYLQRTLENSRYKNKAILYHGGLNQKQKEEALQNFKGDFQILIATEAAAEGLNLQFCPMVINYDLPWNPQRIEQRIGRCHRYGQAFDVVVINFLNQNNIADQRVYELLCDKFQLFEGVFGVSDSVLGSIDALDFEKRIADIYMQCRTEDDIEKSFTDLKESLSPQIDAQLSQIKQKLFENFDEDVTKRLKINHSNSENFITKFENMLWLITKHRLDGRYATFDEENKRFEITATWKQNPFYKGKYNYKRLWGVYEMRKDAPLDQRYRLKGSLAQTLIWDNISQHSRYGSVIFDLTNHGTKFSSLEPLIGKEGHLALYNMEIIYENRRENRLVFAGQTTEGKLLDQKQMQRMFELSGATNTDGKHKYLSFEENQALSEKMQTLYTAEEQRIVEEISIQNSNYFEEETIKLAKWSKDIKIGIERTLREVDKAIDEVNVQLRGRNIPLPKRIELEEQLAILEPKRKELRMQIFNEQDKIDEERNRLIEETKKKLAQRVESKHIFTVKWRVV